MMTLQNDRLLVKISMGRGARIENFIHKDSGKDWVWRPDNLGFDGSQSLEMDASFDDNWAGGWEEVFPNDAPTSVESYKLFDHGEAWRRSWILDQVHENQREITFSLQCETYPVIIRKTFILDESEARLRIDYSLESLASKELPYIFKFHPALSIEEGDSFRMPPSLMEPVSREFSRLLGSGEPTSFPKGLGPKGEEVSIDRVLPPDNHSREFVKLSQLEIGECALLNKRTMTELRIEFYQQELPYVWLYQSYGGFRNYYVALMGPTNGGLQDLAQAAKEKMCSLLRPGEKAQFTLHLRLMEMS